MLVWEGILSSFLTGVRYLSVRGYTLSLLHGIDAKSKSVLVWEGILSSFLTGVRYLSVRGYTLSLLHGIDAKNFEILEERVIAFPAAIVGAVGVALVFFFLAQYRLRTMDVP